MCRYRLARTALVLALGVSPTLSRGEIPTAPGRGELNHSAQDLERVLDHDPCNTELLRSLTQAKWQGVWDVEPELRRSGYRELALLATDLVSRDPRCENQVIKMSAEIGGADYPAALETSLDALIEDPTCWQVHLFRGQVLTKLQQYSEALQALQLALGVVDSESQRLVWQAVGYIHEKRREYAEAEAAYRNAGDLAAVRRATDPVITEEHWPHDTPFLPPPVLRRADPNSSLGLRAREAEQHFDRNPCDAEALRASIHASQLLAGYGAPRGPTRADFRRLALLAAELVTVEPTCSSRWLRMTFEMRAKDYDAATATSRAALVDDPRCIPAHLTIAQILTERREYDAALEELELALALASETERTTLWTQVGYVHAKQHDWILAEIAYRNAGDEDAVLRVLHNQTVTGAPHSCPSVLDEESVRRDRAVIEGRPDAVPPR